MMALLRSRKTMYVLVGLVVIGLVVSGAIGLFQSFNSAPVATPGAQGQQPPPQAQGEQPEPPPEVGALGSPPSGFTYVDQDEAHCAQGQCFRLILIAGEEGEELDVDANEAVETVYEHLLGNGWRQELPENAESSEDIALADSVLTDGETLVADSSAPAAGAVPVLMLGNAGMPAY
ncbi:hypothetical protein [Nocardiopsis alba]|uniref:Uncharacterized protein n=1 Tax=Nocardiopsis alba (strain ATCC BAA-2165 / BE74) TaxID=1205910 RepID=J7LAJ1_NOCAA|nr:hypothetical protein [Nocardiopsis alba]AFR10663.1 hypothetical protein B005_1720 [Nocardiopsis alba ATCC BAA-2165]